MSHPEPQSRFEQFVQRVHLDAALIGVPYVVGRVEAQRNDDWPRIAWIWRGGRIERSEKTARTGGRLVGDQTVSGQARRLGLQFTDWVRAELHLWHRSQAECETLRNDVVGALWRLLGANGAFGDYEWVNEQDDTSEFALSGWSCTLTITAQLLVLVEDKRTTTITEQTFGGVWYSDLDGSPETIVPATP